MCAVEHGGHSSVSSANVDTITAVGLAACVLLASAVTLVVKRRRVGSWCAAVRERCGAGRAWKQPGLSSDDSLQEAGTGNYVAVDLSGGEGAL